MLSFTKPLSHNSCQMVYWYMIHLTFLSCCLLWQKHLTIAGFRQPMGHHCISLNVINFPRPVERKPAHSWLYSWLCLFLSMFSSVQSLSRVRLFTTPWTAACHTSLSITNSRSSLRLSPSSQWCHPDIRYFLIINAAQKHFPFFCNTTYFSS